MRHSVTTVLFARNGAAFLPRTLAALDAQRRLSDRLVVIEVGDDPRNHAELINSGAEVVFKRSDAVGYSQAFNDAVERVDLSATKTGGAQTAADEVVEWFWFLTSDSTPHPGALRELLTVAERAERAAAVGPKQMELSSPQYFSSYGISETGWYRSLYLADGEIDQGQFDGRVDTLGFDVGGLLVRADAFADVGGFDPGLPAADAGLDLGERLWRSGYRVVSAPRARVHSAGLAAPGTRSLAGGSPRWVQNWRYRSATLHRRLAAAHPAASILVWLTIGPAALWRSLIQLLRKQPGGVVAEWFAAVQVAFGGTQVMRARRNQYASVDRSPSSIAPLRITREAAAKRRAADAETYRAITDDSTDRIQFLLTGGGWVVLIAAVLGGIVMLPLIGQGALTGGALTPLGDSITNLWAHAVWGARSADGAVLGPADPFATLLAVLGSLTFWQPSLSIVLLWVLAFPLAALGAWVLTANFTTKVVVRAIMAFVWALAPPLLAAIVDGRPGAVLAHIALPWLVLALTRAGRSWRAGAMGGILGAVVAASAPSLIPALLILWIVTIALSGRGWYRVLPVPTMMIALFAPLAIAQWLRGTPLAVFADPAWATRYSPERGLSLVAAYPNADHGLITSVWQFTGLDWMQGEWGILLFGAPLLVLVAFGFLVGRVRTSIVALALALTGLAGASVASGIAVMVDRDVAVPVWNGSSLSLLWLGYLVAVVSGLAWMRRGSQWLALVAGIATVALAVGPITTLAVGEARVQQTSPATVPALVSATSRTDPGLRVLMIRPTSSGLAVSLTDASGRSLESASTWAQTTVSPDPTRVAAAELAGALVTTDSAALDGRLRELGIRFVVLESDVDNGPAADQARSQLDLNGSLDRASDSDIGTLWSVVGASQTAAAPAAVAGTGLSAWVAPMQLLILVLTILVALPAGRLAADPVTLRRLRSRMHMQRRSRRKRMLDRESRVRGVKADDSLQLFTDETDEDMAADTLGTRA